MSTAPLPNGGKSEARRRADGTRRLRTVTRKVRDLEGLYAERSDLFAELNDLGVSQREIAEIAGVTPVAVCKVLAKRTR